MMNFFPNKLRQKMIDRHAAAKAAKSYGYVFRGAEAFRHGLTPVDCPYPLGSVEQRAWWTGWQALFDRRFNL